MDHHKLRQRAEQHFEIQMGRMDAEEIKRIEFCDNIFTADRFKLVPKEKPCDHCDRVVANRRVSYQLKEYEYRDRFWEIKCLSCGEKHTTKKLSKFKKL